MCMFSTKVSSMCMFSTKVSRDKDIRPKTEAAHPHLKCFGVYTTSTHHHHLHPTNPHPREFWSRAARNNVSLNMTKIVMLKPNCNQSGHDSQTCSVITGCTGEKLGHLFAYMPNDPSVCRAYLFASWWMRAHSIGISLMSRPKPTGTPGTRWRLSLLA